MSDRPVAAKLLIKPGTRVWLSDPAREALIMPLPAGAAVVESLADGDVAVVFAPDGDAARAALEQHASDLARVPVFWIAYPKGNRADINRDSLWPMVAAYGMRPITQVAVDEVWSGLRFRPLREDEPPFTGAG